MATAVEIMKFEGDVRAWVINANDTETAVCADADDAYGNRPIECEGSIFNYEAGDTVEVISKGLGRYNQVINSEIQPGSSGLTLTLLEVPPAILAVMFAADQAADVVTTTAAIVDESHTVTAKGIWYNLNKRELRTSPAPVVKVLAATIATTEYVIDYRRGRIFINSDAAGIVVTDAILVSYTHNTYTVTSFNGGLTPQRNMRFSFECRNRALTTQYFYIEVPKASMAREGDFDIFGTEPLKPVIKGSIVLVTGNAAPYTIARRVAVSV